MRKSSIYSVRPSHGGSLASQASNAQLTAKLREKKKEFDALRTLEWMSAEYIRRLEAIDLDCNVMADAGKVQGEVSSQWPEMFRILSLSAPQNSPSEQTGQDVTPPSKTCERLVRVPLDELQQQSNAR